VVILFIHRQFVNQVALVTIAASGHLKLTKPVGGDCGLGA